MTTYGGLSAAELRALREKATPGKWAEFCESGEWWVSGTDDEGADITFVCESSIEMGNGTGDDLVSGVWRSQDDINLMVAAVNALPALLDEADALRARVAALEALCADRL